MPGWRERRAHLAMMYSYYYDHFNNSRAGGDHDGHFLLNDWQWYNSTYFWVGTAVSQLLYDYVGQPYDLASYCWPAHIIRHFHFSSHHHSAGKSEPCSF